MMKWTEKISDLCMSFFKKTLDLIQYMNSEGNLNNTHLPTLFVHSPWRTLFRWVCNSSEEMFRDVNKYTSLLSNLF